MVERRIAWQTLVVGEYWRVHAMRHLAFFLSFFSRVSLSCTERERERALFLYFSISLLLLFMTQKSWRYWNKAMARSWVWTFWNWRCLVVTDHLKPRPVGTFSELASRCITVPRIPFVTWDSQNHQRNTTLILLLSNWR